MRILKDPHLSTCISKITYDDHDFYIDEVKNVRHAWRRLIQLKFSKVKELRLDSPTHKMVNQLLRIFEELIHLKKVDIVDAKDKWIDKLCLALDFMPQVDHLRLDSNSPNASKLLPTIDSYVKVRSILTSVRWIWAHDDDDDLAARVARIVRQGYALEELGIRFYHKSKDEDTVILNNLKSTESYLTQLHRLHLRLRCHVNYTTLEWIAACKQLR